MIGLPPGIYPNAAVVFGPVAIAEAAGSHWNVARTVMTPALFAYEVMPLTPASVWAGDEYGEHGWRDTAFLVFPDEQSALAALLAAGLAVEIGNGL